MLLFVSTVSDRLARETNLGEKTLLMKILELGESGFELKLHLVHLVMKFVTGKDGKVGLICLQLKSWADDKCI